MNKRNRKNIILFLVLAVIAAIIYPFEADFSKGLFAGLGIAAVIYIIREFLPKRK
tara:strand:+ start:126 stop:290 length:165 start_codon:yes stop_codon:yes gene_type:complete